MLTLYRGIIVPLNAKDAVSRAISTQGITGGEGFWNFTKVAPSASPRTLLTKPDLTLQDTRVDQKTAVVCCCGDYEGAAFYATRSIKMGEVGLVIEVQSSKSEVYIDGRDFLYTAFQLWDRTTNTAFSRQAEWLKRIFGGAVVEYFERTAHTTDQQTRIALCDLACHDADVIEAHRSNRYVLGGRYNTVFRSAFFVTAPIAPKQIRPITIVPSGWTAPTPDIDLRDFLEGRLPQG